MITSELVCPRYMTAEDGLLFRRWGTEHVLGTPKARYILAHSRYCNTSSPAVRPASHGESAAAVGAPPWHFSRDPYKVTTFTSRLRPLACVTNRSNHTPTPTPLIFAYCPILVGFRVIVEFRLIECHRVGEAEGPMYV